MLNFIQCFWSLPTHLVNSSHIHPTPLMPNFVSFLWRRFNNLCNLVCVVHSLLGWGPATGLGTISQEPHLKENWFSFPKTLSTIHSSFLLHARINWLDLVQVSYRQAQVLWFHDCNGSFMSRRCGFTDSLQTLALTAFPHTLPWWSLSIVGCDIDVTFVAEYSTVT